MKPKKILSVLMAMLMALSLLPSLVFASEAQAVKLDGKLKIKGTASVGSVLRAEYKKVIPEGITDEDVTFQWSRKTGDELTEVGKEKTYTLVQEDMGNRIQLKITGNEELGFTGELKALSVEVVAEGETPAPDEDNEDDLTQQDVQIPEAAGEGASDADVDVQGDTQDTDIPEAGDDTQDANIPETGDDTQDTDIPGAGDDTQDANIPEAGGDTQDTNIPEASDDGTTGAAQDIPADTDNSAIQINNEETLNIPETTDADAPELTYSAEVSMDNSTGVLDFGSAEAGYTQLPGEQYVTITNTGTGDLNFTSVSPEHFMVQDITEPLKAGESVNVWVQPREGIPAGIYKDTITYTTEEGAQASFEADFTVNEAAQVTDGNGEDTNAPQDQQKTDPAPSVTPDVPAGTALTFDPVTAGYTELPAGKSVSFSNQAGTAEAQLKAVLDAGAQAAFTAAFSADTLAAGATEPSVLTVQPVAGLTAGTYSGNVTVQVNGVDFATYPVSLTVNAPAAASLAADPASGSTLAFDSVKEGYAAAPDAKSVTVSNSGNAAANLTAVLDEAGQNAFTAALSQASIAGGESAILAVQPKMGLKAGTYTGQVSVLNDGNVVFTYTLSLTVAPADVFGLSVNPSIVDFGTVKAGYTEAPQAGTVTVKNEGNTTINLKQPTGGDFEVGALSAVTLAPGESATFTVRPKTGLAEGLFDQDIVVASDNSQTSVKAILTVAKAEVKLTGITKPSQITGLANGTKKSATALKLPETVVISTTNGKMKASVKWDVNGSSYDPDSTDAQTFTVKGTVKLPSGVTNPDQISTIVSAKVSVNGRSAVLADPSGNTIAGIDPNAAYTTATKITVTANGAGMNNTDPGTGDTRYIPASWKVLEERKWEQAPYSATFRMAKAGSYTMTVVFNQQKYDGSNWVNTGAQDAKQVNFNVSQADGQDLTPAANRTDANQKNAVRTGDNTPIMTFVIILVVAVICIIGVVVYRKKKK
ncbi:MAG: choice-of-anchor D domain-containing protein [Blautia sp.]